MSTDSQRISRRTLLASGGAAAFWLSIPGMAFGRTRRHRRRLHSHLRRSSYTPLINQNFTVGPHRLRLVAVQDLNPAQAGSENAFALVFRGRPGDTSVARTVPTFRHPQLGAFELFITSGRPSAGGRSYVAVINRLHA